MFNEKVRDLTLSSLVADAYCLGSHWVYDEEQLKTLKTDWNELNKACSVWHKGKMAGEFTHYGDQLYILHKFLEDKTQFDVKEYVHVWAEKMDIYNGYIDGSTRETLANIEKGDEVPCGAFSHDLSVIGRIAPLLKVSETKESFLQNVQSFVKATHNDVTVLEAAHFFASLLLEVLNGKDIVLAISELKEHYSTTVQSWINDALASKEEESFDAIRKFGPACDVNEGFAGVIHILCKYSDFKEAMMANAKAGGDNSGRGMIIAFLLVAKYGVSKIPASWMNIKVQV
jgi:ADP-ribosylglycohydrolase